MPATYVNIASQTLSSTASSVTFSSIPATYTDLVLRISARDTATGPVYAEAYGKPNNQTTGASIRRLQTINGSTVVSNSDSPVAVFYSTSSSATSNTFSSVEIYIPSYTVSIDKQSSFFSVAENNATAAAISVGASLWTSTATVSSYVINAQSNFAIGSTFYLYGIKNS